MPDTSAPTNSRAPQRSEPTGHTQLPLSRVKKIIHKDADVSHCSNNAAFAITRAAEMFIMHLAETSLNQARAERKPRRNIQYKDVANAVSHLDNLEFLEDIVPKTVLFSKIRDAAQETQARLRGGKEVNGEGDQDCSIPPSPSEGPSTAVAPADGGAAITVSLRDDDRDSDDANDQLELEMQQAAAGFRRPTHDRDVPMSG
ncbi:Histone-like transcription factor and archaeal histone family protein [Drechmeria coniospora]|uniref:Histone-like transcription factor and archaeal histone family protein n=1 Tax=Drechmeria coniospora TaxID=98403 RepID=A0A151GR67_DRECN|nr:Histone-like transcription factor and archaeal histone family protein [Drechmeria coniospora]KYK59599.1 Histone-like transcription factor and archaeal histone family protein [Drechmeria coniospora]ODA76709.1 hypothetical protein RJ55_07980 [Drechmeria coniospora]